MKKVLSVIVALFIMLCCLSGCDSAPKAEKWQKEYVDTAIEKLTDLWQGEYSGQDDIESYYLEIKNTRIISILENDVKEFKDIEYIVEFIIFADMYDSAPYYMNSYMYNTVAFYKDGSSAVIPKNLFEIYGSKNYSYDFSEIIDEIYDLEHAYNQVIEFDDVPQQEDVQQDTLPTEESALSGGAALTIRDEDGNILITNQDVSSVYADFNEESGYFIGIKFNEDGTEKFTQVTRDNVGKALPIYVDDVCVSKPRIEAEITGGEAMLSGFSEEEQILDLFEKLTK